jgi:hypothetical protein
LRNFLQFSLGVLAARVNQHLLVLIAVVVGLLLVVSLLSALLSRRPSDYPYESYHSLLSPAERSFFGVLQQALQGEFTLLAKVRASGHLARAPQRLGSTPSRCFQPCQFEAR